MILIIGGGFTGLGVGLALLERGYKDFCILEKNSDILMETSASSLRIIHSGIRFLSRFQLFEFFNSLKSSKELKFRFRESIRPLECYALILSRDILPFDIDLNLFSLKKDSFFSQKGIYLHWEDGFLESLDSLRAKLKDALIENLRLDTEVTEVHEDYVNVGKKRYYFKKAVICSFPSFNYCNFKTLYAWNIISDLRPEKDICVGLKKENRYFFATCREGRYVFGTWYSSNKPNQEDITLSLSDIKNVFGKNVENFTLELGVLPSINGKEPIDKTRIIQLKKNIWVIYASKFTTFINTGRLIATRLL